MKYKMKKGGYMEPSKEVKFGGPKKKMQAGGDRRTAAERAEDDKLYGKGSSNASVDLGYESVAQMNKYAKLYGNRSKSKAWHDQNNAAKKKNTAAKKKLAKIKVNERSNKGAMFQKGGLTQGKGKVSTSGKSRKRNPNERTPVDPRPSDEMTFLPPGTRGKKQKGGLKTPTAKQKGLKKLPTSVRNKMGFKMMGGKKNKKFLGGLAGAIGGAKGAEGGFGKKLLGAAKGALGGGMLGRAAGAVKGAMGGGGLQGAMQGLKGGAFGNSNPMGGGAQAAADPAAQDPNAAVARNGGLKDRRKAAKKRMKKSKASAKRSAKKINSKNAVS
tara:strand:+ start:802 stop:1782 length:981 start_codon:yes stop_codon:yes gene_type:complete